MSSKNRVTRYANTVELKTIRLAERKDGPFKCNTVLGMDKLFFMKLFVHYVLSIPVDIFARNISRFTLSKNMDN